ncbi:hypothetical protein PYCC9005_001217 [Savitreella phatthalungensis]
MPRKTSSSCSSSIACVRALEPRNDSENFRHFLSKLVHLSMLVVPEDLSSSIAVRPARSDAELDLSKAMRLEVFSNEQDFDPAIDIDEYDSPFPREDVAHLIAFAGSDAGAADENAESLLGTVRLIRKDGFAKITRLAVGKEARGVQLGRRLVFACEQYAKDTWNLSRVDLSAQHQVRGFYEKCGYVYDEDKGYYDEEGWQHCWMTKKAI